MNNLFTRLTDWLRYPLKARPAVRIELDRPLKRGEMLNYGRGVSPLPLSRETQNGMLRIFATREHLFKNLNIDNYWDAKRAELDMWLSAMDAQAAKAKAHLASKEADNA